MDLDRDGSEEILLAGVNNRYGQATLVTFRSDNVSAGSQQPGRRWLGIPEGSDRDVVLFPGTCVAQFKPHNRVIQMRVIPAGRIQIVVSEDVAEESSDGTIIYELDYDLNVMSARPDVYFRTAHRD